MNTESHKDQLRALVRELRTRAARMGTLSALWDPVWDMEAFLADKPTLLQKTLNEWIQYAEDLQSRYQ